MIFSIFNSDGPHHNNRIDPWKRLHNMVLVWTRSAFKLQKLGLSEVILG